MTWGERRAPKAVHFMRRRVGGAPSPALKLFHFTPREGLTGGEGHPPQTPRQRSISRHGRVTWGEGRRAPVTDTQACGGLSPRRTPAWLWHVHVLIPTDTVCALSLFDLALQRIRAGNRGSNGHSREVSGNRRRVGARAGCVCAHPHRQQHCAPRRPCHPATACWWARGAQRCGRARTPW